MNFSAKSLSSKTKPERPDPQVADGGMDDVPALVPDALLGLGGNPRGSAVM